MSGLIVLFWFVAEGVALRYFVRISDSGYISMTNWPYTGPFHRSHVLPLRGLGCHRQLFFHYFQINPSDSRLTDDTIARKVNSSDASQFAHVCGCYPSQGLCVCTFLISALANHCGAFVPHSLGCALAHHRSHLLCSRTYSWFGCIQTISGTAKRGRKAFPACPRFELWCCIDSQYT